MTDIGLDRANTTIGVGNASLAVAMTPVGRYAYVANSGSGTVSVISGAGTSRPKLATVMTGFDIPTGVAFTPDGQLGYVTDARAAPSA